eukprot:15328240-Ditylum_brightwellii.AAC.1
MMTTNGATKVSETPPAASLLQRKCPNSVHKQLTLSLNALAGKAKGGNIPLVKLPGGKPPAAPSGGNPVNKFSKIHVTMLSISTANKAPKHFKSNAAVPTLQLVDFSEYDPMRAHISSKEKIAFKCTTTICKKTEILTLESIYQSSNQAERS